MMLCRLRTMSKLLNQTSKLRRFANKRGNADWFRPRFVGGKAEPHEPWKVFKQCMYTDGDKILIFSSCFFIVMCMTVYNYIYFDEIQAWYQWNAKVYVAQPMPVRDES